MSSAINILGALALLIGGSPSFAAQPAQISPPVLSNPEIDDIRAVMSGGKYTGSGNHTYTVRVTDLGPDRFDWRRDSEPWNHQILIAAGRSQPLSEGVTVRFGSAEQGISRQVNQTWIATVNRGTIGPFVVADRNDLTVSSSHFESHENAQYTVVITASGNNDKYRWSCVGSSKCNGTLSPELAIRAGEHEDLSNGLTITFASSSGHAINDQFTVNVTVAGEGGNFIHRFLKSVPRAAEDKARDLLSGKDFGMFCDGVHDDSNSLDSAIAAAWSVGEVLHLPAGDCLIRRTINLPTGTGTLAIEGTQSAIFFDLARPTATRLHFTNVGGSDHLLASSSSFSIPTYSFSHLSVVGPDYGLASAGSGSGLKVVGRATARVLLNDVIFTGFKGTGTRALWLESAEDGELHNVYINDVYSCAQLGALVPFVQGGGSDFNQNNLFNLQCQHWQETGVRILGSDEVNWHGGLLQLGQGTGLYIHGVVSSTFIGLHFERTHMKCTIPEEQPCPDDDGAIKIESSIGNAVQNIEFIGTGFYGPHQNVVSAGGSPGWNMTNVEFDKGYANGQAAPMFALNEYTRGWTIRDLTGASTAPTAGPVFVGVGLNDATLCGSLTNTAKPAVFAATIIAGVPDTFVLSRDGRAVGSPMPVRAQTCQVLDDGVGLQWKATSGHTSGDRWLVTTSQANTFVSDRGYNNVVVAGNTRTGTGSTPFLIAGTGSIEIMDASQFDLAGTGFKGKLNFRNSRTDRWRLIQSGTSTAYSYVDQTNDPDGSFRIFGLKNQSAPELDVMSHVYRSNKEACVGILTVICRFTLDVHGSVGISGDLTVTGMASSNGSVLATRNWVNETALKSIVAGPGISINDSNGQRVIATNPAVPLRGSVTCPANQNVASVSVDGSGHLTGTCH